MRSIQCTCSHFAILTGGQIKAIVALKYGKIKPRYEVLTATESGLFLVRAGNGSRDTPVYSSIDVNVTLHCVHSWCAREAVTGPMSGSEGMLTLLLGLLSPAPFTGFMKVRNVPYLTLGLFR